jgi:hypothetical protein
MIEIRRKRVIGKIAALALLLLAGSWCASAGPYLVLNPLDGHLTGAPGDSVGWGFTIFGDDTLWISFTGSSLTHTASVAQLYTDYIGVNGGPTDFAIGPGGSWTQVFDSSLLTGIGEYLIDPGAPLSSQDTGTIVINYQAYDGDPVVDGNPVGGAAQLFLFDSSTPSFTLDVQTPPSGVPEPGTFGTMAVLFGGCLAFGVRRRRTRRSA